MKTPLVTIAIPAYKKKWLATAIESAVSQDYKNIEIVIVDDNSPQQLYGIIEPFLKDPRIKYYRNEKNFGAQSIVLNWNRCLEYAKGDFFVLLCDDDIMSHDFVSSLLSLSQIHPKCIVFHARKWDLGKDGKKKESLRWPEYETGEHFFKERLSKHRHHTISEFLIKTSALRKCGGYVVFPSGFYSDNASIIQLVQVGGIVSSDKCLLSFRHSDEHITGSTSPKNCWDKFLAALAYLKWIQRIPESKDYSQQIYEDVECTIYNSYKYAPLSIKLKILLMTPLKVVSLKQRFGYIYNTFTPMNPIISIVVPVWNAAKTLKRCVSSVFLQTFTEWELILSDDGSSDESLNMCYSLSNECDKIRILSNKHHGVSHARNVALDHARGEYVCFIDADDTVEPDYLEILYSHRDSDMVVCGYQVDWCDEQGKVIESQEYCQKESLYCFNKRKEMKNLFVSGIMHMNWNKLFKKELIDTFSIRYKPYPINEDFIFMMEYLLHCKSLYVAEKATYHWIRMKNVQSGVDSLPENIIYIYCHAHALLKHFFIGSERTVNEIMYYSYALIVLKCLRIIKHKGSDKSVLAKQILKVLMSNENVISSYKTYKPVSLGDKFQHWSLMNQHYRIFQFFQKIHEYMKK